MRTPRVQERKSAQQVAATEVMGVEEHKSAQWTLATEVPGVCECESAQWQQAALREEPSVWDHKSKKCTASRLNKTFAMVSFLLLTFPQTKVSKVYVL